ncbi:hypothetical protein AMTR_s00149p00071830 [Amborella trichopoda]|uniref:Uncharacterized protein n=1 Tax=Amborella trichopoda TaxID=13333 RepID=W1PH16_AMBTC|nr:hypothetical protein AMTR_s00149p00071830 [Amborella trichopoda]
MTTTRARLMRKARLKRAMVEMRKECETDEEDERRTKRINDKKREIKIDEENERSTKRKNDKGKVVAEDEEKGSLGYFREDQKRADGLQAAISVAGSLGKVVC